ncbi:RDD family protein [Clostridium sp. KNHs214]|uniref:RDD family protein n=1 Tax=Clostridium sp. KNHs214 TaxID=1540257 RepID=UPI00054EA486|nr:RDD family protein [Clostridium sp. KNHs214]
MVKSKEKLLNEENKKNKEYKDVSVWRRAVAMMVDWYLASVLAGVPVMLIYSMDTGQATIASSLSAMSFKSGMLAGILAILASSAYYLLIPTFLYKGQTLGKKLLGIKVIRMDNKDVSLKTMFRREIIGIMLVEGRIVSSSEYLRQMIRLGLNSNRYYVVLEYIGTIITIVSVILMYATVEKRMIHDYIGKTKVVRM